MGMFWREAREKAGLTQAQVSARFGYTSPQFISNWERDVAPIPEKVIPKLTKIYNLKREDVIEHLVVQERNRLVRMFKRH